MKPLKTISLLIIVIFIFACNSSNTVYDSQGNSYQTKKFGKQVWMIENLKFEVADESFCYNDNPAECDTMGRLYTWEGAKLAAAQIEGWHIPTKDEWHEFLDMTGMDSTGLALIMSEDFGFNPQPAGVRISSGRSIAKQHGIINLWSASISDTSNAVAYSIALWPHLKKVSPHNYPIKNACNVRLIKD